MTINVFFVFLAGFLIGMYTFFVPNYTTTHEVTEVPKIELNDFILYETSHTGIEHILEGKEGKKFDEYYTVTSAKFRDNTKKLLQSITANDLDYRNNIVNLKGNIHYVRADGLEFRSNEAQYDTKSSIIQTNGSFFITQNMNQITGSKLIYNTDQDTVSADHIQGSYQLK